MDLFSLTLTGYRRFKTATHLRTNGKLVALVGPNESGKSSVIQALHHLDHAEAPHASEVSRGSAPGDLQIKAKFLLGQDELESANLTAPRWMTVEKRSDGVRYYGFDPPPPERDISHRDPTVGRVRSVIENAFYREKLSEGEKGLIDRIDAALDEVLDAPPNIPKSLLNSLRTLRDEFESSLAGEDSRPVQRAIEAWSGLIELERAPSPLRFAIDQLNSKTPEFLLFDDKARALASSYAISELRSEIPPALQNLADVAGLSFPELFRIVDSGDGPALTTIEHKANELLSKRFSASWQQSGVTVAFRLSQSLLEVQVVNELSEFSALAERSDGLRQFVALHAFALRQRASKPVLLIDEAEQRLHYDAQADLVQMLAKQEVAPKVIYTTHSAGCLPEDLGNGVRLVKPAADDPSASIVVNKFWAERGEGFIPLLIGMGASTLAFFPTRRAVMVEGPADMLLYPTMFREFVGAGVLGFQFVPGLSTTAEVLGPLIPGEGSHVVYLTDADEGGLAIVEKLQSAGVRRDRIITLRNRDGTAVEVEDFIDPAILLRGANNLIDRFHAGSAPLQRSDLQTDRRMGSLEGAYAASTGVELPKIELAYEVLGILDDNPDTVILDGRRRAAFGKIVTRILRLFGA